MIGPDQAPTRAAVLELKDERVVVSEAYDFLDEKRLLLAAELLRQLERYEQVLADVESLSEKAAGQLAASVRLHGLQGMTVYPPATLEGVEVQLQQRNFMGVTLVETELYAPAPEESAQTLAMNPSIEAERCRALFQKILRRGAVLAGLSGNLYRLLKEYRVTERRARALENVILPEIEHALADMGAHLEEMDLEDAVRARLQGTAG